MDVHTSPSGIADRFLAHLRTGELVPVGSRVLAAVSGGGDSTALLCLLIDAAAERRLAIEVACVDHRMRSGTAEETASVAELAGSAGLAFHALALAPPPRPLSEAAMRTARADALASCARECRADVVALGHQADDVAETVVMRLLRGTGIDGLAGIPERSGPFVRPLLPFRRAELRGWLRERGLGWVEDPTNADVDRLRAMVRCRLLPALRRADPRIDEALLDAASELASAGRALRRWEADWLDRHGAPLAGGLAVPAAALALEPVPSRGRLLREAFERLGVKRWSVGRRALAAAAALADSPRSGALVPLGSGLVAGRFPDAVVVGPPQSPLGPAESPIAPGANRSEPLGIEMIVGGDVGGCVLRNRRPGDRIAGRRRTLKRVLIDAGVPRPLRDRVPVIALGSGILWADGLGVAPGWEGTVDVTARRGAWAEWLARSGRAVVTGDSLCYRKIVGGRALIRPER